jgi:predicted nucleotidyltransferase
MNTMMTCSDFASKLGIGTERVRQLCKQGRIKGAERVTLGAISVWMIPSDADDPRLVVGRPKKDRYKPEGIHRMEAKSKFQKIEIDAAQVASRLLAGRAEADRIINEMRKLGVTVELFGSMKAGKIFPTSDIDLLVTDCGSLAPTEVMYEIDCLSGAIAVDVTILSLVPKSAIPRVMESLNG